MTRRSALIAFIVLVCGLAAAFGAARAATARAVEVAPLDLFRERLYLIQGYLESHANDHFNYYPPASSVHETGKLERPLWPDNPWTSEPMKPGTSLGDFTYKPAEDRLSYTLTGHGPQGDIVLTDAVPYRRMMQNDHRTVEQCELVQQYVERWALNHGGIYPPASEVSHEGSVGDQSFIKWWPHNVWTHQPIAQSSDMGDFKYLRSTSGSGYRISANFSRSKGKFLLTGYLPTEKTALTIAAATRIGRALQLYGLVRGAYPAQIEPGGALEASRRRLAAQPVQGRADGERRPRRDRRLRAAPAGRRLPALRQRHGRPSL